MKIEIPDSLYNQIKNDFMLNGGKNKSDIPKYIYEILYDSTEIIPTRKEKAEWKTSIYNTLILISEYHDDLRPRKKDSFDTLIDSYLYWVDEYNDKYLPEKGAEAVSKRCAYIVQEYNKRHR